MRYIGKIVGLTTIIVLFSSSIRAQKSASIYLGKSASNRIEFGAGQLQSSLAKQGIKVSVFRSVPKKPVSKGGNLVFAGTPEELATCPTSMTGHYLKRNLS